MENQLEPNNDAEEENGPINDQADRVIYPENFDFMEENIVNNRDDAAEPNVQDNDILDPEPLVRDDPPPLADQEVLGNEQDNLMQDPQAAGEEGGWNPDALMEDLTWEKV